MRTLSISYQRRGKTLVFAMLYNFDTVSKRSFISELGYSQLSEESGRSLSHAHRPSSSGSRVPSSIWVTYLPSTGKNL